MEIYKSEFVQKHIKYWFENREVNGKYGKYIVKLFRNIENIGKNCNSCVLDDCAGDDVAVLQNNFFKDKNVLLHWMVSTSM